MISRSEQYDALLKIGMGWLGWTEQQTLDTNIPALLLAYEGRQDMIQQTSRVMFGAPAEPEEITPMPAETILNAFRLAAGPPKK